MSEWWTYRPANFLLFSARAYWRMFELANEAYWPLPIAAWIVGVAWCVVLAWFVAKRDSSRERASQREVSFLRLSLACLALIWLWVAWSFLYSRYAPIHWVMHGFSMAFAAQAAAMFLLSFRADIVLTTRNWRKRFGVLLTLFAIAIYPLLSLVAGRSLTQSEVFAIAPDPTIVATLGFLLLLKAKSRLSRWGLRCLLIVPIAYAAQSCATLVTMGAIEAWPLGALTAAALFLVTFIRERSA
jgi:hypothetical protein